MALVAGDSGLGKGLELLDFSMDQSFRDDLMCEMCLSIEP